ncbi:MAG TPA: tetratricopeptide repeat protein [Bacteroidales bacterium]|nr:tetratricopeptide repeat protein [Bacteroidales bacterium]
MKYLFLLVFLSFVISFDGLCQSSLIKAAQQYEKEGNYKEAIRYYGEVYKRKQNGTEESLYKLGEIYSLLNDPNADFYLEEYLKSYGNGEFVDYAYYWLGNNLLWCDNPDYNNAIRNFKSVISISKKTDLKLKSLFCLGECYLNSRQWDKAKSSFQGIIDSPAIEANWYYLIKNNAVNKISTIDEQAADNYYSEGLIAMESGDYQKAYDLFYKVIGDKTNKQYKSSILKAASCKFQIKEYNEVIRLLKNSNYNDLTDRLTYNHLYAFSLLRKANPDYKNAINPLHQIEVNKKQGIDYLNLVYYNLGLCYEKTGDTREAIYWYNRFTINFPDDSNINKAKKAIERLQNKIESDKIFSFGNFYTYSKRVTDDTLTLVINELLADCYLQQNGNPGVIFVPVNIDNVKVGQAVVVILKQTPFMDSRIAYLQVDTEIPRSSLNVFKPVIQICVSQDYHCCIRGENQVLKKEITGIWGEGFTGFIKYDKSMHFEFLIESLGRSFKSNFGEYKKESALQIGIILGNSQNLATDLINNAKAKSSNILYISGLGVE